jgi:hypothetical protein
VAARIKEVADGVAAAIAVGWGSPAPATVHTDLIPDIAPDEVSDLSGRHVYVFQAGYGSPGPLDRSYDINDYRISVVVVEHYDDAAGLPTNSWINDLIDWCETHIWAKLSNARTPLLTTLIPFGADVVMVYDPELLREESLFLSEFLFTFREYA